jgi:hypothetical protein
MKKEIVIAIILTLVAVIGAYFIGTEEEPEYTGGYKTITVMPGETLWSIAGDIESEKDIREVIHIIKKDNGMTESNINAWQKLKIRENY